MNKKISYGSINEVIQREMTNPKCFEDDKPLPQSFAVGVERLDEYDPEGEKAHKLAKKYRKKR